MIETHPFGNFVPPNAKYLILGSFTGKEAVKGTVAFDASYDWFYGTKRNQFWSILEEVYGIKLKDKLSKQALFTKLGIAIMDIIYRCDLKFNNNLDSNLIKKVHNIEPITKILDSNHIDRIFLPVGVWKKNLKRFSRILSGAMQT